MGPLAIAAAIAGIISVIKGIIDAQATAQWEANVSGKLDNIIIQNSLILAELEQLPLLFAINLQAAFATEVVIKGNSLASAFDQYMHGDGKTPDIRQIESIRTEVEVLCDDIVQRGPCVYEAANAVMALVLAVHKILHVDRVETQTFVDAMLVYMTDSAGNADGMFGRAIAQTQAILQQASSTLGHEPRGTVSIYSVQSEVSGPGGGGRRPHMFITLKVIADITIDDNNLTFSVSNARSTWFDVDHLDDQTVASQAGICARRIQSEINTINAIKARLNTLQSHEQALQSMISSLSAWHA